MGLDFRNVNTIWASLIAETFYRLGLKNAVISPGSRSTPLTIAFANHPHINTIPILDERSASFFGLGIAKTTNLPTILICTSGTAGANFFPAIIEAKYSHIPLIILTADRPPELRNCHGGQTINQVNLYGNYPTWQTELSLPNFELEKLFYLRQNIIYAWERSQMPIKGVVHLNVPFDEPLAPIKTLNLLPEKQDFINQQLFNKFPEPNFNLFPSLSPDLKLVDQWSKYQTGIIIAGIDSNSNINPQLYCQAIANLAEVLNCPVLAEALSPVRNYSQINHHLVTNYEVILRNSILAEELIPEFVILIGEYPTSKTLRFWLNKYKIKTYIITENYDNLDALHSNSIHLRINPIELSKFIDNNSRVNQTNNHIYLDKWLKIDLEINDKINELMKQTDDLLEAKVSWLLSQNLPLQTSVIIANSMSVRYAEFFWQKNNNKYDIYFSRGANGIDGTLSTALGIASQNKSSVLLTGDLALLHDTNGFLIKQYFQGSLTIILINNQGGGIFEMLPVAEFNEVFEDYFATPQTVKFEDLCKTYNLEYYLINNWQELESLIKNLPDKGIRILEIQTNRKKDSLWLNNYLSKFSKNS